jgi:uncharacterized membrane protein YkoI
MKTQTKVGITAMAAIALAAGGVGIAGATSGDSETPIRGRALEKASIAALDATGGGRVTASEVGDEESYYEVEVTKADGSQTDVQLDRDFNVVGQSADGDSPHDGSR